MLKESPFILYSDGKGNIFEDTTLYVTGRSGWFVGALLGTVHAVFDGTVLVNVLLPVVHPRIATAETAANDIALIEPPGFLLLNYGRNSFIVALVAHIAFGIVIGLIVRP